MTTTPKEKIWLVYAPKIHRKEITQVNGFGEVLSMPIPEIHPMVPVGELHGWQLVARIKYGNTKALDQIKELQASVKIVVAEGIAEQITQNENEVKTPGSVYFTALNNKKKFDGPTTY